MPDLCVSANFRASIDVCRFVHEIRHWLLVGDRVHFREDSPFQQRTFTCIQNSENAETFSAPTYRRSSEVYTIKKVLTLCFQWLTVLQRNDFAIGLDSRRNTVLPFN